MKSVAKSKMIEVVETQRLLARKPVKDDFDLVFRLYQNPQVMRTLGGILPKDAAYEKFIWNLSLWEKNGFGQWLWFEKKSDLFVGRAGLRQFKMPEIQKHGDIVELGYVLFPQFWGKGLATEIAQASIKIAFHFLQINELVAFMLTTNLASQRVVEKTGFRFGRYFIHDKELHKLYRLKIISSYENKT